MLARCEVTPDGCWIFRGALNSKGYGSVGIDEQGTTALAHRVSWEAHRGPIPDGMTLDHLCRNKPCLNPEHMEQVTRAENSARTKPSSALYCKRGHPMFGKLGHWKIRPNGYRRYITCHSADSLERYHQRKSPADVAFERQPNGGSA